MECKALDCQWNYRKACLHGASEASNEEAKRQIDTTGTTWFTPFFEITEDGRCANYERK